MKMTLAATLFALATLPLLAQQTPQRGVPNTPASQPGMTHEQDSAPAATTNPSADQETSASSTPSATQAAPVELRPVPAQLLSKLDSKTAKTGDDIVVETGASVKTADGIEIPKGSKLVGHVLAVRSSGGQNSQVVLQFDQAELKDGQKLPVQTEIQSIAPPAGESHGGAEASPGSAANGTSSEDAPGSRTTAAPNGAVANGGAKGAETTGASSEAGTTSAAAPAAGTIVSRNGKIAIRTTSVPGLLLANNAPGEQDPRMARTAGILVGTQRDIHLEGGTQLIIGVATTAVKSK